MFLPHRVSMQVKIRNVSVPRPSEASEPLLAIVSSHSPGDNIPVTAPRAVRLKSLKSYCTAAAVVAAFGFPTPA